MSVDHGGSGDDGGGLPTDHWTRARPVFEELGRIESPNEAAAIQTLGEHGRYGWYQSRPADEETVEDGYGEIGGPFLLPNDYDALTAAADRDVYATICYHDPDVVRDRWTPVERTSDGWNWQGGENPLPEYRDIVSMAPFVDIDLDDEHKERPLDDETRALVEDVVEAYADAFADLLGDPDAVFALDSGGGVYVLGAAAATVRIGAAESFRDDRDATARVFNEYADRLNAWIGDVAEQVAEEYPETVGVFEPDALNHKNRLYKAPLSPHADIDGVVHPIEPAAPSYEFVPFDTVDDELIDETEQWAAAFTDPEHADCVESIVETLWPEYSAETDGWEAALWAWIEDEREREEQEAKRRREAKEAWENRAEELDTDLSGLPVTPAIDDVYAAVDAVDVKPLVKRHCDEWEPKPAERDNHFNPGRSLWKESDSGTSCFVNEDENMFVDVGDPGGKGGPAKLVALKEGIISHPQYELGGEDYWRAINALRDEGYEIPVYVPEAGTPKPGGGEYERTPLWALRNAAVALDLIPEEGFIRKEGDDGGEYLDFPGKRTRKEALDTLAGLGIEHGWDDPTEGDDAEHADAGDQDRPEYDVSHPVYEVLDPEQGDVELHLVPIDGTSTGVEITQNGKVEYSEVLDRGFWNNRTIRDRVASEVANTLTGVDQEAVKRGVKDALNQVGIDEREEPDEFEADMRSDREQELRDRTIEVVCHPTADTAEWIVTMEPPADSPVTEPRELSFSEGDFNDGNAGTFKNLHVAKFYTKVEIDHKEWDGLTDYWLANQVTADYEPDLDLEAAVDKFIEWCENLRVWADEDGFSWSNPHGYYVEEYHDGEDAVLVPGQKINDWKQRENIDPDLNLSKELRERDIMLHSTDPKWINGKRRRVWPVAAEAVGHDADTALRTETDADEDGDDDRPEGLR